MYSTVACWLRTCYKDNGEMTCLTSTCTLSSPQANGRSLYCLLLSKKRITMPPSCDTVPEADAADTKMADPKIIDLIKAREGEGQGPFTSLEFFPPRTDEGVKNLYARMERMKESTSPLFTDITWGAGGSTADLSLDLALHMHNNGHVANMHLTCTNMDESIIRDALQKCLDGGIRNIVALRGDPPEGQDEWKATEGGFTCALDLVKYMRAEFGDAFGIAVAGYPEGHPNAITELKPEEVENMTESEKKRCSVIDGVTAVCRDEDYKKEMDYLKEKVDAGADVIITQMFFDPEVFVNWVKDCRAWGIDCPIIPGLMCITAYAGFKKMIGFCKTRVPPALEEKMESMKDDKDAVKQFGIEYGAEVCQKLLDAGACGLHFYTLNLEKVVYGTLDKLGISSGLLEQSNEKDAASMVAKGSAWCKKGDTVKSSAGEGTVVEIKADGTAVVDIGGETHELAKGAYEKLGNAV